MVLENTRSLQNPVKTLEVFVKSLGILMKSYEKTRMFFAEQEGFCENPVKTPGFFEKIL